MRGAENTSPLTKPGTPRITPSILIFNHPGGERHQISGWILGGFWGIARLIDKKFLNGNFAPQE